MPSGTATDIQDFPGLVMPDFLLDEVALSQGALSEDLLIILPV
jgi:hypothetical protein